MYYIYVLRCVDNSLYTGITTNVERRFQEHKQQLKKGARYTRVHTPLKIEMVFSCDNRSQASKFEYWFKRLLKNQKEMMIKNKDSFQILLGQRLNVEDYQQLKGKNDDEKSEVR